MQNTLRPEANKRLSKLTLFAYGCGDFASNLCWTFIGSYLTVFYTDVVGMAPAVAAAIMLIARIWDGINDPMFGAIAERTNTKKGRFRPYIFYGAPFLALFSVLAFTTIGSGTTAVLWAAFTYIGCGMLYTVVNLSYGSLSTVMTTNPEDIAQLNSFRMMGTNLSSVLLNAITPPLLLMISGTDTYTARSYTIMAIIFAICALPLFYFVYANCKETVRPVSAKPAPLGKSIKAVLGNGPLMLIFLIQLLAMTAFFGRMGVVLYYLMYNVQRMDLISAFMSLPSLFTVIGIFLTKNFQVKVGKKKMASIGYIGSGLSLIAIYFVGWSNIPLLLVLHCIYGFCCFSFPIPMAMIPDAINYEEDRHGVRSDGISYATVSLSTKFGSAFGASGALLIMGFFGYVANAQQTPEAMNGINLTVNLIFGVMYLLCLIPLYFYPLGEKRAAEIRASLDAKFAARQNQD
ncbi:glycoside-pentoside-hexuronide (GPH):cation symporter [Subdoligranulum variabile]|uniref:MFS transporter n=1 Tax=Subdoligranulum variabile TaxID=214851 RepID=UPI0029422569|nr:glycoside-pentoside-hexuronide (GPH):cation symporter [Subdoligranulum variabile]